MADQFKPGWVDNLAHLPKQEQEKAAAPRRFFRTNYNRESAARGGRKGRARGGRSRKVDQILSELDECEP